MNYERSGDDGLLFIGSDTHEITFVASKFAVASFLCALDAVAKKFRGENKQ